MIDGDWLAMSKSVCGILAAIYGRWQCGDGIATNLKNRQRHRSRVDGDSARAILKWQTYVNIHFVILQNLESNIGIHLHYGQLRVKI